MAKTQKCAEECAEDVRAVQEGLNPSSDKLPQGLRYVDDSRAGYTRKRSRGVFAYFDTQGKRISSERDILRINSLAIPPAYTEVWICPDPHGHLQATGRDARGRKQYRYHPDWRATRDADKYERLLAFGAVLPKLRARVKRDLALDGIPRDKVLATVVRLLDTTLIRVGSEEYARENHSYGLTTLRKRHVKISAGTLRFKFRGKSGIEHDVAVNDARIARIMKRCMDLPGQDLFQYLDADGTRHVVGSADVNAYLREATGTDFTAKDYRTWAGSVFALAALSKLEWATVTEARRQIVATIKEVSRLLRNTPAVCRKCYVHPAIIDAFEAGELLNANCVSRRRGLKNGEASLCVFLEKHAKRRAREARQDRENLKSGETELTRLLVRSVRSVRSRRKVPDAANGRVVAMAG